MLIYLRFIFIKSSINLSISSYSSPESVRIDTAVRWLSACSTPTRLCQQVTMDPPLSLTWSACSVRQCVCVCVCVCVKRGKQSEILMNAGQDRTAKPTLFCFNLGFIFIVSTIIFNSYNNIVLIKAIVKIWECCDLATTNSYRERQSVQTENLVDSVMALHVRVKIVVQNMNNLFRPQHIWTVST